MNIQKTNKLKILNDPIYGLISIPKTLVFDLIEHRFFQRLRRISQMGLSYLVYPGAHHTRFHHATGCVYLMHKAVRVLRSKGVEISDAEETGLYIAILLHDIGHGPFSHALENVLLEGVSHEDISLAYMNQLNSEFPGELDLAISIFKGDYQRAFCHQLVSSQLDIDRLDYLKRDSFYTGVAEGSINSDRLISMMNVVDNQLVLEEKGIYSIEKFIVARRLMYWQVYLHKTGVVAEYMLVALVKRAKLLYQKGELNYLPDTLSFFFGLKSNPNLDSEVLNAFAKIDDIDILGAIKSWVSDSDFVLRKLSAAILDRNLFRIEFSNTEFNAEYIAKIKEEIVRNYTCSQEDLDFLCFSGSVKNLAYNNIENKINLLKKNGQLVDFVEASDPIVADRIAQETVRYFICYPKELNFSTL